MQFTAQQAATIKAYILATPALASMASGPGTDYAALAAALNATNGFIGWRTDCPVDSIQDAIIFANMTPAQAIPADLTGATVWSAKALACQGKQFNLQNLIIGKAFIDASRPNIRAAFQDALTAIPSKSDGTTQAAGWAAVQTAMQRLATLAEKLLATGTGTAQQPATFGWQGTVQINNVSEMFQA